MDPWVHCQRLLEMDSWIGLGFRHRILCRGICHPRWPSLHLFLPLVGRRVVGTGAGPTPCAGPYGPDGPDGPNGLAPTNIFGTIGTWWRDVWWRFHPSKRRRRRLFRVQFPHLRFTASPWLHGLYGMQAGIFQKWVWKKTWIKRGPGNFFSMPQHKQTYKVSEFENGYGYWCCSWIFSGFQWSDNMFLDVSGQVRKLHGCIADNFHPVSRAPGIGMPLPCGHFVFFAPSLVLRCGIGSEMSTPNLKTTLHKVFWSCFRNKWAGSLAVGLFSHCWIHLCRSKVCNAMASGRNMCRPARPVC